MVLKSYDTLGGPTTNGVMFMAKKFRDANPKVTRAVYAALVEASEFINKAPRQAGEIYILDLGPCYRGYFAQLCRTLPKAGAACT